MGRAPCCDKANVKKGPWSPEEDVKLKDYIDQFGTGGNWIALPQKIGLRRCGKSCRLRWLNYLRPNIKHGDFSEEEDRIICSLFASIGSRWSIIAAQLPGRTDNDIKNYWNTKLKKKLFAMISSPLSSHQRKPSLSHMTDSIFINPNYNGVPLGDEPISYPPPNHHHHHHLHLPNTTTATYIFGNYQPQKQGNFVDPLLYFTYENKNHQTPASCNDTSNSDGSCSQSQISYNHSFQNYNQYGGGNNNVNQWSNLDQENINGYGVPLSPNHHIQQIGYDLDLDFQEVKQQITMNTSTAVGFDQEQAKIMYYY